MTSKGSPPGWVLDAREAYVWAWLPEAESPVVAGRLEAVGEDALVFNYGESYLLRADAMPLYLPELPLVRGLIEPFEGLRMPGCIADAMPDAWGQRVVIQHLAAAGGEPVDPGPLAFLLASGSDRIGALDFQASADRYEHRGGEAASLEELLEAAARVDEGIALTPDLDRALLHGSSVGGARPKALLEDAGRRLIAKFSSSTDRHPVVQGEFLAMELAREAGLEVAPVAIERVLGRNVLLVERFDRVSASGGERRRSLVSALTILGLDEMHARYASYADLAETVRARFSAAASTLRELFGRITFNILVGNTDDHARNHAAFWDGESLMLTPAYDICPQARSGGEASQGMAIAEDGSRLSQLRTCVEAAPTYLLDAAEAREIIDRQIAVIEERWTEVCERAELTEPERRYFWGRQFLNPFALEGYRP